MNQAVDAFLIFKLKRSIDEAANSWHSNLPGADEARLNPKHYLVGNIPAAGELCEIASKQHATSWEGHREQKRKSLELVKKDLQRSGKVKPVFLNGILEDVGDKDVASSEICPKVRKEVDPTFNGIEGENCSSRAIKSHVFSSNSLNKSYKELCIAFVNKMREVHGADETCGDKKTTQREPPGEEIAPDEPVYKRANTVPAEPIGQPRINLGNGGIGRGRGTGATSQ